LLCKFFRENKKLNLELKNVFSEVASLRSVHDEMSANPYENCAMIMVSYADMRICSSCIIMLHVYLMVTDWNSESLKPIPCFWVLALVVCCLDLIWRLLPLRLKILSTNLILLLTRLFYLLHTSHVSLSRVSFSMLPKRTPSFIRRLPI
jgi:hypothetical protein